jgi:hypothetical protein
MEKMRSAFTAAADKHIVTVKAEPTMDAHRAQLIKSMLQIQRFTSEEIEKLGDLLDISNEELGEHVNANPDIKKQAI